MDRAIDLASVFVTPLTYEALIHEVSLVLVADCLVHHHQRGIDFDRRRNCRKDGGRSRHHPDEQQRHAVLRDCGLQHLRHSQVPEGEVARGAGYIQTNPVSCSDVQLQTEGQPMQYQRAVELCEEGGNDPGARGQCADASGSGALRGA